MTRVFDNVDGDRGFRIELAPGEQPLPRTDVVAAYVEDERYRPDGSDGCLAPGVHLDPAKFDRSWTPPVTEEERY